LYDEFKLWEFTRSTWSEYHRNEDDSNLKYIKKFSAFDPIKRIKDRKAFIDGASYYGEWILNE